ncbi:MAG TPA: hypothetical protein PK967_01140 [Candidatus Hydrogenedentes bacterium]|nr:hypothetical protein [Candidatus Hydrogenedentota bacterium]
MVVAAEEEGQVGEVVAVALVAEEDKAAGVAGAEISSMPAANAKQLEEVVAVVGVDEEAQVVVEVVVPVVVAEVQAAIFLDKQAIRETTPESILFYLHLQAQEILEIQVKVGQVMDSLGIFILGRKVVLPVQLALEEQEAMVVWAELGGLGHKGPLEVAP